MIIYFCNTLSLSNNWQTKIACRWSKDLKVWFLVTQKYFPNSVLITLFRNLDQSLSDLSSLLFYKNKSIPMYNHLICLQVVLSIKIYCFELQSSTKVGTDAEIGNEQLWNQRAPVALLIFLPPKTKCRLFHLLSQI